MKKLLSILLMAILVATLFSFAGCSKPETLKFGLGTYAYTENAASAQGSKNGALEVVSTIAAVLVSEDGKIAKCEIDCADTALNFNEKGEYVKIAEFKTKLEKGADYGMVAYAGAKKEWFEQADIFEGLVAGKTIDEVKALVANEGKGTDEVINAGCTIAIADFVSALEKAVANAKESAATAEDTLKLGIVSSQTGKNANDKTAGSNEVETTITAAAVADGKVTAATTDAYQASVAFDAKGVTDTKAADIATKLEKGNDYGMVAYGGAKKEWFEQAAAFDAALIGKNADEIAALATSDGKPVDTLVTAGCTIAVSDMVKAAVKASK